MRLNSSTASRLAWAALPALVVVVVPARQIAAQAAGSRQPPAAQSDSAFHVLQARGQTVMGVDQYTSTHRFEMLPDGGRIVLERLENDSAGIATIRAHMRAVAAAFEKGDFSMSRQVHAMEVPGTRTLASRRAEVAYSVEELARGAAVRVKTTDPEALAALKVFFDFQNADHRTGHHR